MRKATIFIVLALLLTLCATPVYANGIPALPHAFYGTVTINGGSPAPVGTQISATVNIGDIISTQNPVTTVGGSYGIGGLYLLVQGYGIPDDAIITFWVDGIRVEGQTAIFEAGGGPDRRDLALVITPESITGEVVETIPAGQTDYVVDASDIADTTITVSTTAEVTITVTKYYGNPHPEAAPPASMLPRYIDIEVDNLDAIIWPMRVEQTYTDAEVAGLNESSLAMYYFKAGAWHRCSDTGVNTVANYIWANMTRDELSGTPVAIGGAPPAPPAGGGGAAAVGVVTAVGSIDLTLYLDAEGKTTVEIHLSSADGRVTIVIPVGTKMLDAEGNPLGIITIEMLMTPPPPPGYALVGPAYDCRPDGATFEPYITLTFTYDPADIPTEVSEEDLVLAYWDGDEWVMLPTTVDTVANTVTAGVTHFTPFGILARLPLAPAAFAVSALTVSPTEVNVGETVTISVLVANTGEATGSYEVTLKVNGVVVATKEVTVAGGTSQEVTFTTTKDVAGTYTVDVNGLVDEFVVRVPPVPPVPPAPAAFSLSNLSVQPAEVQPEETVTITVSVANTGGTEGSYAVVLNINGVKEAEKTVTIAAGGSETVTFSVTKEDAARYSVTVDGLSGSFTVVAPAINWPLIGGIIAAVIIVALLVFFLVFRRRAY